MVDEEHECDPPGARRWQKTRDWTCDECETRWILVKVMTQVYIDLGYTYRPRYYWHQAKYTSVCSQCGLAIVWPAEEGAWVTTDKYSNEYCDNAEEWHGDHTPTAGVTSLDLENV